ncbi:MAG: WD40/YVTN/BNR-like repeat-containing protein [Acidobacteriota bacterium]
MRAHAAFTPAAPSPARPAGVAADAVKPLEIVSPGTSVRWRIEGATVEQSLDGGATWTKQVTGTRVPLTAGVSPASGVCWIVGRHGTVLRSIDGRSWQSVAFPDTADLVAVHSRSASEATVTTADARRFTTLDGGVTWKPAGLQEF